MALTLLLITTSDSGVSLQEYSNVRVDAPTPMGEGLRDTSQRPSRCRARICRQRRATLRNTWGDVLQPRAPTADRRKRPVTRGLHEYEPRQTLLRMTSSITSSINLTWPSIHYLRWKAGTSAWSLRESSLEGQQRQLMLKVSKQKLGIKTVVNPAFNSVPNFRPSNFVYANSDMSDNIRKSGKIQYSTNARRHV